MIKYPLAKQTIDDGDIESLIEWLKTSPRLTKDKYTLQLEKMWANFIGTKYSVFCNSGSSANLLMTYLLLSEKLLKKGVINESENGETEGEIKSNGEESS